MARRRFKFFPSIAELRELAGLQPPIDPHQALNQQAEQAWEVISQDTDGKPYNRAALLDPVTKAVFREMGSGYKTEVGFGRWPKEKDELKRREFIRRYLAHVEKEAPQLSHSEASSFLRRTGLGNMIANRNDIDSVS